MAENDDFDVEILNMDLFDIRDYENTFEYNFAIDVIRYVLKHRMTGLHWKPEGIFEARDAAEHPASYTPEMSLAVREKLDRYEHLYHEDFDDYVLEENVSRERYIALCKAERSELLNEDFTLRDFFRFTVVLAKYAGYAYLFGITDAPQLAHAVIVAGVRRLKQIGEIREDFPNLVQAWLENPELTDFEDIESDSSTKSEATVELD